MRVSITLVAMAIGVYASPTPNSLFSRQTECAAINQACLSTGDLALLGPLLESRPEISLDEATAALTCCAGSTCSGGTVALPESLELLSDIDLPYQSCTDN